MEHLIVQLKKKIKNFITTGFKSKQIENYFGDGKSGVKIIYSFRVLKQIPLKEYLMHEIQLKRIFYYYIRQLLSLNLDKLFNFIKKKTYMFKFM